MKRFEIPELSEGFASIYYVKLENNQYYIQNHPHEI
jgi:hypothetical protein